MGQVRGVLLVACIEGYARLEQSLEREGWCGRVSKTGRPPEMRKPEPGGRFGGVFSSFSSMAGKTGTEFLLPQDV